MYPNGFTDAGQYRVVFYARDKSDGYATPKLVLPGAHPAQHWVYLSLVRRR